MLVKLLNELNYCDFIRELKIDNKNIKSFNELDGKIKQDYIDFLVYEYIKKNSNTFIVTVWPVCQGGNDIIRKHYSENCKIIYYKEIRLDPTAYHNFLHYVSDKKNHKSGVDLWFAKPYSDKNPLRIYVIETLPHLLKNSNHSMKVFLSKIFNNNTGYINKIFKERGVIGLKNLYITTRNKRRCRNELHKANKVPRVLKETPPYHYSHHINDFHEESIDLGRIVLNNNTLKLMQHFKWGGLKGFHTKFNNFKKYLKRNKIDNDKILIYNSAILGPFGLREPSDIDFLQLDKKLIKQHSLPPDIDIQNKYFKRGYMILQNKNKAQYMEDNPRFMHNVSTNSPEIIWKLSLNDIIFNPKNYYYYLGIKFMEPKIFQKVKKIRGRPKDLDQVKLVSKLL